MKRFATLFSFWIACFQCVPVTAAESAEVRDLRSYRAPDHLRLVFDVSGPLEYRLFPLQKPDRIVIDIDNARLTRALPALTEGRDVIHQVRTGHHGKDGLRVVLDLARSLRPKTFLLPPGGQYGHRLVVDLFETQVASPTPGTAKAVPSGPAEWVIAIDAGHGGDDPGAVGKRYRTREKDVVLAIARELEALVKATPGMRPLMTRAGDYYIPLGNRPRIAREQHADIFISIHADAVPGRRARGSSVYALTERGASDRMAKYLADSENAADVAGGVIGDDIKDRTLQRVLIDLAETKNIDHSLTLGQDVLNELKRIGPVHRRSVGQAGFAVLKSAGTPSVLVETAFISNATEEKKLRDPAFQKQVARAVLAGVRRFLTRRLFQPNARILQARQDGRSVPPGQAKWHIVERGDSLSSIARKYDVNVDALRFANNISGSALEVGRRLVIP